MSENLKDDATVTAVEGAPEAIESSDRRSFIKGTVFVAGAVAAGGLAASIASASPSPDDLDVSQGPIAAIARPPVGTLHVVFNRGNVPTLDDIIKILPDIFGPTGCRLCGLVGLDIRFGLDTLLTTQLKNVNLNLEGTLPGR